MCFTFRNVYIINKQNASSDYALKSNALCMYMGDLLLSQSKDMR